MMCCKQPFWKFVNCYSLLVQRYFMDFIPMKWLYGYTVTKIIKKMEHFDKILMTVQLKKKKHPWNSYLLLCLQKKCFLNERMKLAVDIYCEGVPGWKLFSWRNAGHFLPGIHQINQLAWPWWEITVEYPNCCAVTCKSLWQPGGTDRLFSVRFQQHARGRKYLVRL